MKKHNQGAKNKKRKPPSNKNQTEQHVVLNKRRTKRKRPKNNSVKTESVPKKRPKKRQHQKREPRVSEQQELGKTTFQKTVSLVFNILYYIVVITLLMGSTLFAFNSNPDKSYLGYQFYNVLTNSMVPQKDSLPGGFHAQDIIIVKRIPQDEIKVDDIVTFKIGDGGRVLTHRVVGKLSELNDEEGNFLVTRGDANNADDPPFSAEKVVGKVTFVIPRVGGVLNFIRLNFWLCLMFIGFLVALMLTLKYYFTADFSKKKTK